MRVLCLLLILFAFSAPGLAQKPAPARLSIAVQQNYPPFIYMVDGQIGGVCMDLAEAAFKRMGLSASYRQYPFARMLKMGKYAEADAVMMVFRTAEREAFLEYPSEVLCYEENSLFVRKDSRIRRYSGRLEEYQDQVFGVVNGFSYGNQFDEATYLKKEFSRDELQIIKKIMLGRLSIGVGNREVVSYYARQIGVLDGLHFLEPNLFLRKPLYIAFPKGKANSKEISESFSKALNQVKRSEEYKRILFRHGLNPILPYGEQ